MDFFLCAEEHEHLALDLRAIEACVGILVVEVELEELIQQLLAVGLEVLECSVAEFRIFDNCWSLELLDGLDLSLNLP